ncbi:metalloregulator ArsR/SmtB family transcription factor [Kribbella sp.]|uniref:ArsR/SmtB family transcription factor n=1 Tax=Kribbella sp. TaxID=1871183 RepID=UPI002D45E854|nr:metalloregulator ArsR/SmtB family transcription factor [Kribbella sp.]HZX05466.1 metalloregulator ArsR/SmtB family transcription factor [Kribbella sp.]
MPDEPADPFRAIADPTRRRILELLMERRGLTVGELAAEFPELVTSGISKHLMTLRAAGLVVAVKAGRHQHYRIDDGGLDAAFGTWISRYESYWANALDKLHDAATADRSAPDNARRT